MKMDVKISYAKCRPFKLSRPQCVDGESVTNNNKVSTETGNEFFINTALSLAKTIPHMNKSPLFGMDDYLRESYYLWRKGQHIS